MGGNLKIFYGYAPCSGTTYAMLKAAHEARNNNVDVVVGYIDSDCCPETARLKKGLEVLPHLKIRRDEEVIDEFDLDGALKRNPGLIIVDDLIRRTYSGMFIPCTV